MKHLIYFVIIAKLCCLWAAVQLFECWSECYYGRAGIKETDYSITLMLIRMLLWQGWYWRDINYSIIWMLIRIWLLQGWYWSILTSTDLVCSNNRNIEVITSWFHNISVIPDFVARSLRNWVHWFIFWTT